MVWAGRYSAFGQITDITPTATGDNPVIESSLRFPGQIEDAETGLYYNWRRYYDPEIGRYVTQDPIGLEGGMNLYAYVGGDPVNKMDPTGEFGLGGAIVGGVIDAAFEYFTNPCAKPSDIMKAAVIGAITGALGGKVVANYVKGIGNIKKKGDIGEFLSRIKNWLKGSREDIYNRHRATIPGHRTKVDSTWTSITGKKYYVESKTFGSPLSDLQKRALNDPNIDYRVERWVDADFERIGGIPGGGAGIVVDKMTDSKCSCEL